MEKTCVLAAVLFFIANLFILGIEIQTKIIHQENFGKVRDLDPDYLEEDFAYRRDVLPFYTASKVLNVAAWMCFTIPMMQLCIVISNGGKRRVLLHVTMAVLVLAGSTSEVMAKLFSLGTAHVEKYLAIKFNMDSWNNDGDGWGWKTMSILSLVSNGMINWVDAFEFLALSLVLWLNFLSVRGTNMKHFGPTWADMGFMIGVFSLVDFIFSVLRYKDFRFFTRLATSVALLNRLVLLPIWLIMMGRQLDPAFAAYRRGGFEEAEDIAAIHNEVEEDPIVSSLEMTETVSRPTHTIDEGIDDK